MNPSPKNLKLPTILAIGGRDLNGIFEVLVFNFVTHLRGVVMKPIVAQLRVGSAFVLSKTSSASLRSHAEFQGNFNDGWTKVVLVWAYFDATTLLHPFTICPPQEDGGTIGEQKPRFRNRIHGDLYSIGFQGASMVIE